MLALPNADHDHKKSFSPTTPWSHVQIKTTHMNSDFETQNDKLCNLSQWPRVLNDPIQCPPTYDAKLEAPTIGLQLSVFKIEVFNAV